ncbi:MAG: hypothetical protein ISQ23_00015 [Alphaproteobacteria bacterium]|nr:hypothetical protein [Alphaproteobacteria bacterium]MBL6775872.1 hypothetical protein [Alphaproteobacteria bacterium]
MPSSPLSPKPPLSARLNQFWANMLTPLNAYIGTGLIILLLIMSLAGLLLGGKEPRHVSVSVQDEGVSVIIGDGAENQQQHKHSLEGGNNFEFEGQFGRDSSGYHGPEYHGPEYHGPGQHGGGHYGGWHHGPGQHGGWHHGGGAIFGLVTAIMLAGVVGLIAKLILIESHLAALRQRTDTPPAAKTARTAGRPKGTVKTKAKTKTQKKAGKKAPKAKRKTAKKGR